MIWQLLYLKLKLLIFTMLAGIFIPVSAWGVSGFGCIGATVAEYLIPGLGYGILGHYDKMLVLGGSRWIVLNKYWQYSSISDYEQNFNKIYKETYNPSKKHEIAMTLVKDSISQELPQNKDGTEPKGDKGMLHTQFY